MSYDLSSYAMDDSDEDEDDDDLELEEGAKGKAFGAGSTAKSVTRVGNTVAQQGLGRLGNVAQVANLVQSGNVLHAVSTGVSGALAPIVAITGPVGLALALVESAFSAKAAASTYSHIKKLEQILELHGGQARPGTREAIVYCCKKKNKKLKRKGLGCIPILGSICNSVYTIGRTISKIRAGTKGVERREQAMVLWSNTLLGDPCAIAACQELLGMKIYEMIKGCIDGDRVLKKKMKSL